MFIHYNEICKLIRHFSDIERLYIILSERTCFLSHLQFYSTFIFAYGNKYLHFTHFLTISKKFKFIFRKMNFKDLV